MIYVGLIALALAFDAVGLLFMHHSMKRSTIACAVAAWSCVLAAIVVGGTR